MRYGFTTGSCAAAAAKAAAYMLLSGRRKEEITILTPKGISFTARLLAIERSQDSVSCAVEKDGGDDPDITSGAWITAKVSYVKTDERRIEYPQVVIEGAKGVGRISRPGLDQPIGAAAINHVPREMIKSEVLSVCQLFDYQGILLVEISVPQGEEIARQTFNPRLGIIGGISILGTSGIVEPMSTQALLDTIRVELSQRRAMGYDHAAIAPGNYGQEFMKRAYGYDLERSIKCSNFIGATIDMAVELGFKRILLTGHIGKLIKVSGGIMNTHSSEGDCRMELLVAAALSCGVETERLKRLLSCVTTEEALRLLEDAGKRQQVMAVVGERVYEHLNKRAKGCMKIDCIIYSNEYGELAKSKEATEWFPLLEQEAEQRI